MSYVVAITMPASAYTYYVKEDGTLGVRSEAKEHETEEAADYALDDYLERYPNDLPYAYVMDPDAEPYDDD